MIDRHLERVDAAGLKAEEALGGPPPRLHREVFLSGAHHRSHPAGIEGLAGPDAPGSQKELPDIGAPQRLQVLLDVLHRPRTRMKGALPIHLGRQKPCFGAPAGHPVLLDFFGGQRNQPHKGKLGHAGMAGPQVGDDQLLPAEVGSLPEDFLDVGHPNGRPRAKPTAVRLALVAQPTGGQALKEPLIAQLQPQSELVDPGPAEEPHVDGMPSLDRQGQPEVGRMSQLPPGHHHSLDARFSPVGNGIPAPLPGLGADRLRRLRAGKVSQQDPRVAGRVPEAGGRRPGATLGAGFDRLENGWRQAHRPDKPSSGDRSHRIRCLAHPHASFSAPVSDLQFQRCQRQR